MKPLAMTPNQAARLVAEVVGGKFASKAALEASLSALLQSLKEGEIETVNYLLAKQGKQFA